MPSTKSKLTPKQMEALLDIVDVAIAIQKLVDNLSARTIAPKFDISRVTLRRRLKKRKESQK